MRVLALRLTARSLVLIACETVLIVVAVSAAAAYRPSRGRAPGTSSRSSTACPRRCSSRRVAQLCLYYADLYDLRLLSDRRELFTRILHALASASLILAAVYYWFPTLIIGRGVFVIVGGARDRAGDRLADRLRVGQPPACARASGCCWSAPTPRPSAWPARSSAAVTSSASRSSASSIPIPARVGSPVLNPGVIGTIDDIPSIVRARRVDRVVVSLADARGKLPMDKLLELRLDGVHFDHLASVYEEYTGKIAVENLRPSWLIFSDGFQQDAGADARPSALLDIAASPHRPRARRGR